jgi:peptidoglycan/xylan/chitin deacetylase (PgdA/CDA1 family)
VALTFDFDGHTNWITSLGQTSPGPMSRGEFGAVGLSRILALLAEYEIKATFFTPGANAITFSPLMEAMVAGGHEVAHHGWMHEPPVRLDEAEERRALELGIEALERITGSRPLGYRAPGCDNSDRTVPLLLEYGFEYDSSLSGGDYEPYWCRVGDRASMDAPFVFGTPVRLVELPFTWHLDDFIYFMFIPSPALMPGLAAPSTVLEIWRGELDYLCDRVGAGVLVTTMHPQVSGRGHRLEMLRTFIEYALERSASFVTCLEYSRRWSSGREPSLPQGCRSD